MKIRLSAALLLAALCITCVSGCASANALQQPAPLPEITISTEPLPQSAAPEPVPAVAPESVPAAAPEPTPAATPAATGPSRVQPQYISKDEAKSIALDHAGLSENDITRLRVDLDYDDGVPEYEVDFRYGGYEYDYDIHAETGKIRSWDKDWDD